VTLTVLLTSPSAPAAGRASLLRTLADHGPLLAPTWEPGRGAELLAAPARAVTAALDEAGADGERPVVVCGVAAGALLALELAATSPERVAGLVLCTGVRPVGTVVRSVHRGVAGLLPVRTLQRLGGQGNALVPVLDDVRPLEHAALAPRVGAPALVPYGARDVLNRRPSEALARALPHGRAVALPGAGAGWLWREPERLLDVLAELRGRR
jgi:pimeloyl-ACP methyl ester carboxylesterase